MNTKDLSMRYKKTPQEIENVLQNHIGELKNHIRYENEMWTVNPNSLEKLDELFGYADEKSDRKKSEHKKTEEKILQKKPRAIGNEQSGNNPPPEKEPSLEEKLQKEKERANTLADELSQLQDKFIELQNGQEAMNSSFIKKQQIRAEAAEHELEKFKQRSREDTKYKDEQIKNLQNRIKEMQDKLVESHNQNNEKQEEINKLSRQIEEIKEDSAQRCSKAELKVIESKRSEEKLYGDLHETELKLQEMSHKVNIASEERNEAIRNMSEMKSEFIGVKSKLIEITAGLSDYLTEIETISDSRILNEENQIESGKAVETAELLENKHKSEPILKELPKIPVELSSVERPKPETFWQKVASFF